MLEAVMAWWLVQSGVTYICVALAIWVIVMLVVYYSPSQYGELKALYKEQEANDDIVYVGLKHSNVAEKLIFRWTTKDVEHYYGD